MHNDTHRLKTSVAISNAVGVELHVLRSQFEDSSGLSA